MTLHILQAAQTLLESEVSAASARLHAIKGVGAGPTGLTPDVVKASQEYKAARGAFDRAFASLRAFNGKYAATLARHRREV